MADAAFFGGDLAGGVAGGGGAGAFAFAGGDFTGGRGVLSAAAGTTVHDLAIS